MEQFQETIWDMKTVRLLADDGIMFIDEPLRIAGKKGSEAGTKLRMSLLDKGN